MKFLAIDTGAKYLTVLAYADGRTEKTYLPDCAMKHSVVLMDAIKDTLSRTHMSPKDCDFFAVVVGPGSFTGIRIGISTVKGLCFACGKPALAVTSFDTLAYSEKSGKLLALIDAGHGYFYGAAYDEKQQLVEAPAYLPFRAVEALIARGFAPVTAENGDMGWEIVDPSAGLYAAVLAKRHELVSAAELSALYLRKSSAEENRK